MSIELDKLMNLADGKVLYDDLRDRLKQAIVIAPMADILDIIDNYGKSDEEDEGMVTNAYFAENPSDQYDKYFETEATAQEIINAFKAGKNVVVCLKVSEESIQWGIMSDTYLVLAAYQEAFEGDGSLEPYDEHFSFSYGNTGGSISGGSIFNGTKTVNGKLRLQVYVD